MPEVLLATEYIESKLVFMELCFSLHMQKSKQVNIIKDEAKDVKNQC